jgi:hypothetical protein
MSCWLLAVCDLGGIRFNIPSFDKELFPRIEAHR